MNKYGTHEHIFPSLFYFLKAFYMEEVWIVQRSRRFSFRLAETDNERMG